MWAPRIYNLATIAQLFSYTRRLWSQPVQADCMIETPCVNVCILDPRTGLCLGCGRTVDEIARWTAMNASERAQIIRELPARLAAYLAAKVAPTAG